MTRADVQTAYGTMIEPTTLRMQRVLPGPIERVWAYLTESELRRQWLAAGDMDMKVGTTFELVWRNDELTDPPGERPAGFGKEHRMESTITELDPPHRLAFTFGSSGAVSFDLEPKSGEVLLTLVHSRLPDRSTMLNVSAGWHRHLDVLEAKARGDMPEPFWEGWMRLKADYDKRLPS